MKTTLIALAILTLPSIAQAHHPRAAYDTDVVTVVEGNLVDVRWRNRHIVFTLSVTGKDGGLEEWRMEAGSIYMLGRGGLSEASFRTGPLVRVAGHLSTALELHRAKQLKYASIFL